MPDQLTPLARISAAIEKLERLKAESTPGAWFESNGMGIETGVEDVVLDAGMSTYDADLIVTLHRTIDAQLAMLHSSQIAMQVDAEFAVSEYENDFVVALADAILGGES